MRMKVNIVKSGDDLEKPKDILQYKEWLNEW